MDNDFRTDDDLTRSQAREALSAAADAAGAVHRRARWTGTYQLAFGLGFAVITLVIGLMERPLNLVVFVVAWAVFVVGMVLWSRRSPVGPRRGRPPVTPSWIATIVLYTAAIAVGSTWFERELGFWVPAAIAVAVPLVLAGARERRA